MFSRRILLPTLLAVVGSVGFMTHNGSAAEIHCYKGSNQQCSGAEIVGEIEPGDLAKLRTFLRRNSAAYSITLRSPGGDIQQAMAIGRLVRDQFLFTSVGFQYDSGNVLYFGSDLHDSCWGSFVECGCASACFLIWAAGIQRLGNALGIHRPRFRDEDFAKLSALEARNVYTRLLGEIGSYLVEMGVPEKYFTRMTQISSQELLILEPEAIDAEMQGSIPYVDEWLRSKCGGRYDVVLREYVQLTGKKLLSGLSPSQQRRLERLNEMLESLGACYKSALVSEFRERRKVL